MQMVGAMWHARAAPRHNASDLPGAADRRYLAPKGTTAPPPAAGPYGVAMIRRLLPHGLLARSLLIIIIPLVLLQVISGVVFYDRHWSNVSRHRANSLAGEIAVLVDLLGQDASAGNVAWISNLAHRTNNLRIALLPDERLAAGAYQPRGNLEHTLTRSLDTIVRLPFVMDRDSIPRAIALHIQLPDDGVLRVVFNSERLISSTTKAFIMWMVGTSVVLAAVATIFMRNQVSPIRRLAIAADNFGRGRDTPDFKPSGATEVRQAASAFIAMRDRRKRQIQQRTEMLAGVSHDLRTPLTRMKLQLAMLSSNPEIKELESDVDVMDRMIQDYLGFARGEVAEPAEAVEIGGLLAEVVHGYRHNGATVALDVKEPIRLPVQRAAFKRCIDNIVTNATRYGRQVQVRAGRDRRVLSITIDDDGPGIPPDQREEVFRPFVRLDQSRNRDTGGTGLGLAIARDIVHSHGGEIALSESPTGGLRASIQLPLQGSFR